MKNSAAILLSVGASAVSAAIAWSIAKDQAPIAGADSPSKDQVVTVSSAFTSPPEALDDLPEDGEGSRWSGRDTTVASQDRNKKSIPTPAGIDPEQWERALDRAEGISKWIKRSREEGRLERRITERVERDQKRIIQQVGLVGESAETVAKELARRQQTYYEKPKALFDAMMNNEESFAELLAIRRMNDQNDGLSPQLEARKEELKREMFGSVLEPGETLSDEEFGRLFRRNEPGNWYHDSDFVADTAGTLSPEDGEALAGYADKMVYLDREYGANRRLYRIERELPITPAQREELMQLYIKTRDPSPEQLRRIIPEEFVDQARSAANRR